MRVRGGRRGKRFQREPVRRRTLPSGAGRRTGWFLQGSSGVNAAIRPAGQVAVEWGGVGEVRRASPERLVWWLCAPLTPLTAPQPYNRVSLGLSRGPPLTLTPLPDRTGGPARYVRIEETGGRLGFITPLTHNFCESCNRVRITCTGQLYMCLGQDDSADLAMALRSGGENGLTAAIIEAIGRKPKGHDFIISRRAPSVAVARHMNVTGG